MDVTYQKRHLTEVEARQKIGRYVTNAMGVAEVIVMDRLSWEYLDWLIANSPPGEIEEWIADCDREREDVGFGPALQSWLYWEYQWREKEGLPRPDWLPPFFGEPESPPTS